jgi:hypothetical protein
MTITSHERFRKAMDLFMRPSGWFRGYAYSNALPDPQSVS